MPGMPPFEDAAAELAWRRASMTFAGLDGLCRSETCPIDGEHDHGLLMREMSIPGPKPLIGGSEIIGEFSGQAGLHVEGGPYRFEVECKLFRYDAMLLVATLAEQASEHGTPGQQFHFYLFGKFDPKERSAQ